MSVSHVPVSVDRDTLASGIAAFVDRCFDDFIIGFVFEGHDRDQIVRHETDLAAVTLGLPGATYGGRPIGTTHGPLRINRGQFRRRLAILSHVLTDEGVPGEVIEQLVAHQSRLEMVITTGKDCAE